jgi:hypothetical protein
MTPLNSTSRSMNVRSTANGSLVRALAALERPPPAGSPRSGQPCACRDRIRRPHCCLLPPAGKKGEGDALSRAIAPARADCGPFICLAAALCHGRRAAGVTSSCGTLLAGDGRQARCAPSLPVLTAPTPSSNSMAPHLILRAPVLHP